MTFRILVTGSRSFSDRQLMVSALSDATMLAHGKPMVLRHGGAKGADALAHAVWLDWHFCWPDLFLPPGVYRADWDLYGKRAGPLRNARMVEDLAEGERIDIGLAFPTRSSIGTWDCVRKAKAAGIPVRIHTG